MCDMQACRGHLLFEEGNHQVGGSGDRGKPCVRTKLEQSRITNTYENTKLELIALHGYINTKVQ